MKRISMFLFLMCSSTVFATQDLSNYEKLRNIASTIQITHFPWEDSRAQNTLTLFLESYTRLFLEFPRAFMPYKKHSEVTQNSLWRHICSGSLNRLCEDKEFHSTFEQTFREMTFQTSLKNEKKEFNVPSNKLLSTSARNLFQSVEKMKIRYFEYRSLYLKELEILASNPKNLEDIHSINSALEKIRQNLKSANETFQSEFVSASQRFPDRLLLSKPFIDMVEGLSLQVQQVDIIRAVNSVTDTLKKEFVFDIVSILASFEDDDISNFIENWNEDLMDLEDRDLKQDLYTQWSALSLRQKPFFRFSQFSIPDVKTETQVSILRNFHGHDGEIIDFLLRAQYQHAAWNMREKNLTLLADRLEAVIEKDIFDPKKVVSIKKLGGGAGTTHVVQFEDQARCVLKPAGLTLENPVDFFITSSSNEIAASVIDRLLDLRGVPLTVKIQVKDFQPGSCQYFAENTTRARDMLEYDGSKPSKFKKPTGRVTKTSDMKFYDWLIDNYDRNVDNYILANDGRMILIDHGFTFKNFLPLPMTWRRLQKMMPSERVYLRLLELDRHPEILKKSLKPWLSHSNIRKITHRIHRVVRLIQEHQQNIDTRDSL